MKYFVIAGEPSGDQHAACLIQALKARDAAADFCIIGGEHMMAEAGDSVIPLNQLAFMGFTQILFHLGQIRRNFKFAKKALMAFQPDVLILVDYPGFNLGMAKWAKIRC